ncbi:MAG: ABC transporter ATP-binding protein [Candidatus Aenigmarchaeota archaeon]|nr:ABC transporter ATP-binding protein [Candidatus Aenigmarchaeota archaeon]
MQSVIELKNVKKTYQLGETPLHVLNGINITIKKGEIVAIMGPSGSGKSTIMHIAGCLDRATSGRVVIDDKDVSKLSDNELAKLRREKIGFVFQFFYLIPALTALENVALPGVFSGKKDRIAVAEKLLRLVNLGDRMYHKPPQLSGGERQRVAIARSMINNPKIIFADEPTGNLDSKSGKDIMNILMKLNKEADVTLVIVTHDQNIASKADRIIYLKDGIIIKEKRRGIK